MNRRTGLLLALMLVLPLAFAPQAAHAGGQAAAAAGQSAYGQDVVLTGLSDLECAEVYEIVVQQTKVQLNYRPAEGAPPEEAAGLTRYSYLALTGGEGGDRTLVIGLMAYATQDPRVYLWGQAAGAEGETIANPDIAVVAQAVNEAVANLKKAPRTYAPRDLAQEVYQLSYVDAESCVKALQQMGYNTTAPKPAVKLGELPIVLAMPQKSPKTVTAAKTANRQPWQMDEDTISSPEERLMILYHTTQVAEVARIKEILETSLDVAARSVLIEGMVIELTESGFKELGFKWEVIKYEDDREATFEPGLERWPLVMLYNAKAHPEDFVREVNLRIEAAIDEGQAEILSSPSVLVLDNRNAEVSVTEDIPILESLIRENTTNFKVRFETVGIIMNIKPRISEDATTVAMQVLVEISEAPEEQFLEVQDQNIAPLITRRAVSTVARVRDNTPFIIGGLIRNEKAHEEDRVPLLGRIPLIGFLFQHRTDRREKREVIIVLTPRVILPGGTNRPVLPKDSERFDFLENRLFRNSYRLKSEDVFDLGFLESNETVIETMARVKRFVRLHPEYVSRSPFREMAAGIIPGEDAVVVRMLFEVVRDNLELYEQIEDGHVLFFSEDPEKPAGFGVKFFKRVLESASPNGKLEGYFERSYPKDVLFLCYSGDPTGGLDAALKAPVARMEWVNVASEDDLERELLERNKLGEDLRYERFALAINEESDLVRLKSTIALREIAKVNNFENLLRLSNFRVGRKIVIPQLGSQDERMFLVDHTVAEFFYKSDYYYHALERELEQSYAIIEQVMGEEGP